MSDKPLKRFPSGASRGSDCDDVRYDLVPRVGLRRVAAVFAKGTKDHGEGNWQKGIPISDCLNHAYHHLRAYLDGDRNEDDLAHAAANLFIAMHFDEKGYPELPPIQPVPATEEERQAAYKASQEAMEQSGEKRVEVARIATTPGQYGEWGGFVRIIDRPTPQEMIVPIGPRPPLTQEQQNEMNDQFHEWFKSSGKTQEASEYAKPLDDESLKKLWAESPKSK